MSITNNKSNCKDDRRDVISYNWMNDLDKIVEIKIDDIYHCFSLGEVYMVQKIMGDRLYRLEHNLVNKSINNSIKNSLLKKLLEVQLPEDFDPQIDLEEDNDIHEIMDVSIRTPSDSEEEYAPRISTHRNTRAGTPL